MAAGVEFEFRFSRQRIGAGPADGPMRILVIGDFSGARGSPQPGLGARRPRKLDMDRFDEVIARVTPAAVLAPGRAAEGEHRLEFTRMDAFGADAIAARLPVLTSLATLRRRLDDPNTFDEAAEVVRGMTAAPAEPPAQPRAGAGPAAAPAGEVAAEGEDDTLERLLGRPASAPSTPTQRSAGLADQLIAQAVAPHVVPDADPRQAVYLQWVDEAMATRLREVIRFPQVRALERSWRSLHELVMALDPDEELEVSLLDATTDELYQDLCGNAEDITNSGLYEAVYGHAAGAADMQPWSMMVIDAGFGADERDTTLLAALAALGASIGTPMLGGAEPALVGAPSFAAPGDPRAWQPDPDAAARWAALRVDDNAEWVALAAPRVLLRLPYGSGGESCDACPLEETGGGSDHEGYLWGQPAFALARLLGIAFRENGWDMEPGDVLELEDLPAHVYKDADGDPQLKPAAEGLLNERALHALLDAGLSPIGSYRDRNAARLLRIQSIARPPTPLAGRWRGGRD